MKFVPDNIYHVYNQGNNHEALFLNDDHYKYFLHLFGGYVLPHCEVLAWCLMPNHFHFQLYADERCLAMKPQGGLVLDPITNGFRKLLSAYAHKFNEKNERSGSLFRPKTKAKCLSDESLNSASLSDYYSNCFYYIHNNPVKDGLVLDAASWRWSSYNFYLGNEGELLCNKQLAVKYRLLDFGNEAGKGNLIDYL